MNAKKRIGHGHPWSEMLLALVLLGAWGCDGDDGAAGPAGVTPTPKPKPPIIKTDLDHDEDLPGMVVEITSITGGTGPGGNFQPGDVMSVTFTLEMNDGKTIPIDQVDFGGILASGPTSNYQAVLAYQRDLLTESVQNADGSYTYTFPVPIPATYLPPLNDTASFGPEDGEMTGQPLLDGTYTVGLEAYKAYTVAGTTYRDAGNATKDFLVGSATRIVQREVVTLANCNQCHESLRIHGTIRRNLNHCLLCHTAGAEDKNVPSAAGGTPGVAIDFKVMIHKIHNGAHLPSVLGVTTNDDGTRKYDATPKPYKIVGFRNSVHDYSHVGFPIWPNLSDPLPRDEGYSKLTSAQKSLENTMRSGAATCVKCHGDPDGDGPLPAPAQGDNAYRVPTRAACGSCHDDIDWTKSYRANLLVMPPQPDNSACLRCHPADGGLLATRAAHQHPLLNPKINPGLVFANAKALEAGSKAPNGKLDPGEKVRLQFTLQDENGQAVDIGTLGRMEVVVTGPTWNRNIVLEERFPNKAFTGSSIDVLVPQKRFLEYVGDAQTGGGGKFTTLGPHWNATGATTTVWARDITFRPSGSSLAAVTVTGQNYCDVLDGKVFDRGDYIVIDDGASREEYLRVQFVKGNRLWFSSTHSPYDQPDVRFPHAAGVSVNVVKLVEKTAGTDYTLDPKTGTITEKKAFGAGSAVIVSYTTDFVIPEVYPTALNDSPDVGEIWGKWAGKKIVDGTYSVGVWGERDISVKVGTETTSYHATSRAAIADFLVGSATKITQSGVISSENNCYACHDDIRFHGAHRRGYASCIVCHGNAGGEDRPQYVAAMAPPTTEVSIDFRQMLHKIHMGKDLANKSTYGVNGFGLGYPNNYTTHYYDHVGFPSMPGGTRNCAACHGAGNDAWKVPAARNHPMGQETPTLVWSIACGSCHDSSVAQSHIGRQISSRGVESCAVCHGDGKKWSVEVMHKLR